jgi:predicted ribosome quality control (RQC) complex YloA/Tae2 family protein
VLHLVELERAARILDARLRGRRLQSLGQPDASSLVLTAYGGEPGEHGRVHLRLVCRAESGRVSELAAPPASLPRPPGFLQALRAHLKGARIRGCRLRGGDRQLALRLETPDGERELLLALFGHRSNLLLLDAEDRILAALRPLTATRPELALGGAWVDPASPPPRSGPDRFAQVPDAELLTAIEAHYAELESRGETRSLRRRLEQALRKQARGLDRKLEKLAAEMAEAEAAATCEREGQLLKSVLPKVRKGDTRVRAHDFETGEEVEIPLDPSRTPAENLEAFFKRYRKALRTLSKGGAQQEAVRAERRALGALEAELEGLGEGEAALADFAARPEVARLLERRAPAERPAPPSRQRRLAGRALPARLSPRRYRTAGGMEVWVGRSDAGNDHLTTRLARGNDLFFHLDGAPGSHVVLRTEGRSDPPAEAVLDACELAVHFSKAKNASRADVHVVPIKNVRKPKGAKPGLVTVHGGKTVHLRRVPARLERVLAARIED